MNIDKAAKLDKAFPGWRADYDSIEEAWDKLAATGSRLDKQREEPYAARELNFASLTFYGDNQEMED